VRAVELVALRQRLAVTQKVLAELLGVHRITVSKWERGELAPSAYHRALLVAFSDACLRVPHVGRRWASAAALRRYGPHIALYRLLQAAFEPGPGAAL